HRLLVPVMHHRLQRLLLPVDQVPILGDIRVEVIQLEPDLRARRHERQLLRREDIETTSTGDQSVIPILELQVEGGSTVELRLPVNNSLEESSPTENAVLQSINIPLRGSTLTLGLGLLLGWLLYQLGISG